MCVCVHVLHLLYVERRGLGGSDDHATRSREAHSTLSNCSQCDAVC